jgi:hypothetical protein
MGWSSGVVNSSRCQVSGVSAASGRERPVKSYEKLIVSDKLIRRFVVVLVLVLVLEAFESLSISMTRTSTTTRTI